jgi:hypothetical protein
MKAVIDEVKQKALARANRDARNRISNLFANRNYAESIGFDAEVDVNQTVLERGTMTVKLPTEVLEEHNALASRGLSTRPSTPWRRPVHGMGFSPGKVLTKQEIAKKKQKARKKHWRKGGFHHPSPANP